MCGSRCPYSFNFKNPCLFSPPYLPLGGNMFRYPRYACFFRYISNSVSPFQLSFHLCPSPQVGIVIPFTPGRERDVYLQCACFVYLSVFSFHFFSFSPNPRPGRVMCPSSMCLFHHIYGDKPHFAYWHGWGSINPCLNLHEIFVRDTPNWLGKQPVRRDSNYIICLILSVWSPSQRLAVAFWDKMDALLWSKVYAR